MLLAKYEVVNLAIGSDGNKSCTYIKNV